MMDAREMFVLGWLRIGLTTVAVVLLSVLVLCVVEVVLPMIFCCERGTKKQHERALLTLLVPAAAGA